MALPRIGGETPIIKYGTELSVRGAHRHQRHDAGHRRRHLQARRHGRRRDRLQGRCRGRRRLAATAILLMALHDVQRHQRPARREGDRRMLGMPGPPAQVRDRSASDHRPVDRRSAAPMCADRGQGVRGRQRLRPGGRHNGARRRSLRLGREAAMRALDHLEQLGRGIDINAADGNDRSASRPANEPRQRGAPALPATRYSESEAIARFTAQALGLPTSHARARAASA